MKDFNTITHRLFIETLARHVRMNERVNEDTDILIMGAVVLFWKHSKNIAYLNQALAFARARNGMRVNAVKAFLMAHTGAEFKKKEFVGGGKMDKLPESFGELTGWLSWADTKAAEPEYSRDKVVLSLVKVIDKDIEKATEAKDEAAVTAFTAAKLALVAVAG